MSSRAFASRILQVSWRWSSLGSRRRFSLQQDSSTTRRFTLFPLLVARRRLGPSRSLGDGPSTIWLELLSVHSNQHNQKSSSRVRCVGGDSSSRKKKHVRWRLHQFCSFNRSSSWRSKWCWCSSQLWRFHLRRLGIELGRVLDADEYPRGATNNSKNSWHRLESSGRLNQP